MRRLVAAFAFGLLAACGTDSAAPDTSSTTEAERLPPSIEDTLDSIVRMTGVGCGAPALGAGFAVAPDLVITSAHVVTGRQPESLGIITADGTELPGTLVAFDPDLDLALLRIPDADLTPVVFVEGEAGDSGVAMVLGSDLVQREVEFDVDAEVIVNWDGVYRDTESRYRGLRVNADIALGDSGGGLFVSETEVLGVIQSRNRSGLRRGYAVGTREIVPWLESVDTSQEVSAPRCA